MRALWLVPFLLSAVFAHAQDFPEDVLTNFRKQARLPMPIAAEKLQISSQNRASELAAIGSLSHWDQQGRGPGLQMTIAGMPLGEFGEVLGAGADPYAVWEAWLASPSHNAVLSDPEWKTWGWGTASAGTSVVYVLRFWKP